MEVLEIIRRRRSIRRYKPDPVPEDKLRKVLEAARLAPSAANRQPWKFIVVRSPEVKEMLKEAYPASWFISAPVIIVACALPREAWVRNDGEEYWKVDVSIAMEHLVLEAVEEGLGTCWIGAFDEEAVKKVLGIPHDVRVVAMTPLGYPAESKEPVKDRKSLDKIVSYDHW